MTKEKLPRPTEAEYKKREANPNDIDFINSYDWSAEVFCENGKHGIKNALGETIVPPLFDDFMMITGWDLKKGDRVVAQQGDKWGVLIADGAGTWLMKPEFDFVGFPNPITHVFKDGKWAVVNILTGEYLISDCETVYAEGGQGGFFFVNGIGIYKKNGKYGVVGQWGAFTDAIFEEVNAEPSARVKVKYNGEWGFVDENNKFTTEEDDCYYSME